MRPGGPSQGDGGKRLSVGSLNTGVGFRDAEREKDRLVGDLGDEEEAQASRWGLRGKKGKSMVDNPLLSAFARLRSELKGCNGTSWGFQSVSPRTGCAGEVG